MVLSILLLKKKLSRGGALNMPSQNLIGFCFVTWLTSLVYHQIIRGSLILGYRAINIFHMNHTFKKKVKKFVRPGINPLWIITGPQGESTSQKDERFLSIRLQGSQAIVKRWNINLKQGCPKFLLGGPHMVRWTFDAAFDYNTGCGPYSIHFMNQARRASQNLIKGRIWLLGRTLNMPDLEVFWLSFLGESYSVSSILIVGPQDESTNIKDQRVFLNSLIFDHYNRYDATPWLFSVIFSRRIQWCLMLSDCWSTTWVAKPQGWEIFYEFDNSIGPIGFH